MMCMDTSFFTHVYLYFLFLLLHSNCHYLCTFVITVELITDTEVKWYCWSVPLYGQLIFLSEYVSICMHVCMCIWNYYYIFLSEYMYARMFVYIKLLYYIFIIITIFDSFFLNECATHQFLDSTFSMIQQHPQSVF